MTTPALFDEHASEGFLRRFRAELVQSVEVDVAVTRLRLSSIDLSHTELTGLRRIRLLLAELRAPELDAEAHALMARSGTRARLVRLSTLVNHGRVEVRVAPLAGWSPDFTVFRGPDGPRSVLLGFHAFELPHPYPGPALGAHFGEEEARLAGKRYDQAWERGHDVGDAIRGLFRRNATVDPAPPRSFARHLNPVDTLPSLG